MASIEKPRAIAETWDAARRRAAATVPTGVADRFGPLRALLGKWALAEVAPGRLMPWIAVAFGFGIVGYYGADREPSAWAAVPAAVIAIAVAYAARMRPVGFPIALGVAAMATGFAVATVQTARIAHPILQTTASSASAATALSCACTSSAPRACPKSLSGSAWRCAKAQRPRSAVSSN
jgi:competence protein ComEC